MLIDADVNQLVSFLQRVTWRVRANACRTEHEALVQLMSPLL